MEVYQETHFCSILLVNYVAYSNSAESGLNFFSSSTSQHNAKPNLLLVFLTKALIHVTSVYENSWTQLDLILYVNQFRS